MRVVGDKRPMGMECQENPHTVALLMDFGLCSVHFSVWPFEGRLLPQCQPRQPKLMGDTAGVSLAHNNCISLCDTEIPV